MNRVFLSKSERNILWDSFRANRKTVDLNSYHKCPALIAELNKALETGRLLQSAVFSECVYAQALANHFGLTEFTNYSKNPRWLTTDLVLLVNSYNLVVRYIYKNKTGSRILIQAGGYGGVDGALITVINKNVFTIEFKEPVAKTSEPDLPKYGEDGNLILTTSWAGNNSQFIPMVREQIEYNLNFWEAAGNNIHNFSPTSVQQAVSDNYTSKKFADVICVEDKDAILTMIPSNQAHLWADVRGEIRPAGRNDYSVWTPKRLRRIINEMGGCIEDSNIKIPFKNLSVVAPRGGLGVSRYKIHPLFFVRPSAVQIVDGVAIFGIEKVRQLNPTISAHMYFRDLKVDEVKSYYDKDNRQND